MDNTNTSYITKMNNWIYFTFTFGNRGPPPLAYFPNSQNSHFFSGMKEIKCDKIDQMSPKVCFSKTYPSKVYSAYISSELCQFIIQGKRRINATMMAKELGVRLTCWLLDVPLTLISSSQYLIIQLLISNNLRSKPSWTRFLGHSDLRSFGT